MFKLFTDLQFFLLFFLRSYSSLHKATVKKNHLKLNPINCYDPDCKEHPIQFYVLVEFQPSFSPKIDKMEYIYRANSAIYTTFYKTPEITRAVYQTGYTRYTVYPVDEVTKDFAQDPFITLVPHPVGSRMEFPQDATQDPS